VTLGKRVADTGRVAATSRKVATRRLPDFSPSSISGLTLWLRADRGVTLVTSGTVNSVSAWADMSGRRNNATPLTVGTQPGFSATGGPNGLPAVTLNGNQFLSGSAELLTAAQATMFLVVKVNITSTERIFHNNSTFVGLAFCTGRFSANARSMEVIGRVGAFDTTSVAQTANWEAWMGQMTTAPLQQFQVNNVPHALNANNLAAIAQSGGFFVGFSNPAAPTQQANASIYEILVYSTVLSTSDINNVLAYIKARTGIW
jgi:hypothetical protein